MNNIDTSVLKSKKLFVLDMDGTFYLGGNLIEGSLDFIKKVRETDRDFLFFTNNSSRISEFYIDKLKKMGCEGSDVKVVTSGDVTIKFLQEKHNGKKVYLMGTGLLEKSFKEAGINLVDEAPDIVVVGFDTTLNYEKLTKACTYIRNGAEFIATHPDINCPTEDGFIPDCGAMCAMISLSTGVKPRYLGKPYRETLDAINLITGYSNKDMVFVGDRLYTDIAIGFNNGVTSILVLSGETKISDLEKSEVKPSFIFPSLAHVAKVL